MDFFHHTVENVCSLVDLLQNGCITRELLKQTGLHRRQTDHTIFKAIGYLARLCWMRRLT